MGIFSGVIIALVCIISLSEIKKEYSALITTALSVVLMLVAVKRGQPLFQYIKSIGTDNGKIYFEVIYKSFGIAILTHFVSEMCSDFGAPSTSSKVEFIGKIAILMTVIPLVESLFSLAEALV